MDLSTLGNLRDLFGAWSFLALGAGLLGAFLSHHCSRAQPSPSVMNAGSLVIAAWPWAMWLLAFFIGFLVIPVSMGYSGPVPAASRHIWLYDKYFATLIALTFATAFAFNALRFPQLRRRASPWLCLVLCLGSAWFICVHLW